MAEFMSFLTDLLHEVCNFLMSEPICWFVGISVLFFIAALVRYIMFGERG